MIEPDAEVATKTLSQPPQTQTGSQPATQKVNKSRKQIEEEIVQRTAEFDNQMKQADPDPLKETLTAAVKSPAAAAPKENQNQNDEQIKRHQSKAMAAIQLQNRNIYITKLLQLFSLVLVGVIAGVMNAYSGGGGEEDPEAEAQKKPSWFLFFLCSPYSGLFLAGKIYTLLHRAIQSKLISLDQPAAKGNIISTLLSYLMKGWTGENIL